MSRADVENLVRKYQEMLAEGTSPEAVYTYLPTLALSSGFRFLWLEGFKGDHVLHPILEGASIPYGDPNGWVLFLDDVRDPAYCGILPTEGVVVCRSSKEAKRECVARGKPPSYMFLDHDLGDLFPDRGISGGIDTTMEFLRWATFKFDNWDFDFSVHSSNPDGCLNIRSLLNSYTRSLSL